MSLNDCIIWSGSIRSDGYGQAYINGKRKAAHRIAWTLANGREPNGCVLHSCDNPLCVNPEHLREGTPKQNMADAKARKRIRHGRWLTVANDILSLRNRGYTINQTAAELDISRSTVKRRLGHEKAHNRMRERHHIMAIQLPQPG